MANDIEEDEQQNHSNCQHKIPWIDIELKEKQFINDEVDYYKAVKTKSKKIHIQRIGSLVFLPDISEVGRSGLFLKKKPWC